VILQNEEKRELARFSLKGSRAATIALEKCAEELTGIPSGAELGGRNPFDESNNPFKKH
jgi:hypothetical protein